MRMLRINGGLYVNVDRIDFLTITPIGDRWDEELEDSVAEIYRAEIVMADGTSRVWATCSTRSGAEIALARLTTLLHGCTHT